MTTDTTTTIDTTMDVHADADAVCDEWARFSSTAPFEVTEVSFQPLDEQRTRVRLRARYEGDQPADTARQRIMHDLERFRSSVEGSPVEGEEPPHAARGGNSGSSIPPGTEAHEQLCGGHGDPQC